MSSSTKIEWTRGDDGTAGSTWNPVTGCTKLSPASPGCQNCYAATFAERWRGTAGHYFEHGFDLQLRTDKLDQPLRWKRPRRIFVNSMSDLFHDQVPDDYIAEVFAAMALAPQHTFMVLSKRHARMRSLVSRGLLDRVDQSAGARGGRVTRWPLPNVWLGVSAENQQWADIRIPALLETPAIVRFASCEPLLGPLDLTRWLDPEGGHCVCETAVIDYSDPERYHPENLERIPNPTCRASHGRALDWVITGGESGGGARPMDPQWARIIRDQCRANGVAFLHKQNGEWGTTGQYGVGVLDGPRIYGSATLDAPHGFVLHEILQRVGKKRAGRELDGRTWDEFPTVSPNNALIGQCNRK